MNIDPSIFKHQTIRLETRYKYEAMVDGEPILFEILDTCPTAASTTSTTSTASAGSTSANSAAGAGDEDSASGGGGNAEAVSWADGVLLVYAVTDRASFNFVRRARAELQSQDVPVALVGNKVDMVHLRQVSTEEGEILGKDFECKFCEVSAAEQVAPVADAFHDLCREVLLARRKSKQSLLDRMLGGTRAYSRGKSDSSLPKD